MTELIINVVNVAGETDPNDRVRLWPPYHRADGGRVVSTAAVDVPLVNGYATVDVLPGPARVQVIAGGVTDTKPRPVMVPDAASVTLRALMEDNFEWEPEIVSLVALMRNEAVAARDDSQAIATQFGSLEGVTSAVAEAEASATAAAGSASSAAGSATTATGAASAAGASESAAAGSASSASSSAASALASMSAADTSETNAAASESAAATSSSSALSSKGAAATSASNAAASESAAASSASASQVSATAAAGSASEALGYRNEVDAAVNDSITTVRGEFTDLTTRSESAADRAETAEAGAAAAASAEVDRLKAGAPEAFDTLLEIADELASNESERSLLTNAIAGKADTAHDHTVEQVTGLQGELDGKAPVSHDHTASQISDATTTGRSVLTASSQAAARTAIGAGTSDLTLGTSTSSAARGDHTHSQYATTTTVTNVSGRVTTLENAQPIIVSSLPASPIPGRIYFTTG